MPTTQPRAVSISVLKGGVGKSTIAINTADILAQRGHDVLFMDLDKNGHASEGLGHGNHYTNFEHDLGDVLFGDANKHDIIKPTGYGFDIAPATNNYGAIENRIQDSEMPSLQLKQKFIGPLLGDEYDYIIVDNSGDKTVLLNNTLVAAENIIIPLEPGGEALNGLKRTKEDLITPLRDYIDLNVLAIVPNKLRYRIDYHYPDRELVEALNRGSPSKVPEFARITSEQWDKIDNGDLTNGDVPTPGIRSDNDFSKAYKNHEPLREYNPDNPQLEHLNEIADIIENGGVNQ